jgi:tRNA modification GTPase
VVIVCRDAADPTACAWTLPQVPRIDVITRCDRVAAAAEVAGGIPTSAATGRGLEDLRATLAAAVAAVPPRESPATLRMAVGVAAARAALTAALADARIAATGLSVDEALVAAHVRRAVDALGEVTGATIGTDLLDRIFSRHCIGK